jgi:hypothetical protein
MSTALLTLILSVMAALPSSRAPHRVDVTGTWLVTWDSGVRTNGAEVIAVTRRGTAELRLTQRGDTVTGFWITPVPLGESAEWPVTGVVRGSELSLVSDTRLVAVGGREVPTHYTWTGSINAAEMRGTMHVHFGSDAAPPRRWEATRGSPGGEGCRHLAANRSGPHARVASIAGSRFVR